MILLSHWGEENDATWCQLQSKAKERTRRQRRIKTTWECNRTINGRPEPGVVDDNGERRWRTTQNKRHKVWETFLGQPNEDGESMSKKNYRNKKQSANSKSGAESKVFCWQIELPVKSEGDDVNVLHMTDKQYDVDDDICHKKLLLAAAITLKKLVLNLKVQDCDIRKSWINSNRAILSSNKLLGFSCQSGNDVCVCVLGKSSATINEF